MPTSEPRHLLVLDIDETLGVRVSKVGRMRRTKVDRRLGEWVGHLENKCQKEAQLDGLVITRRRPRAGDIIGVRS
jgi:hypothetical protein